MAPGTTRDKRKGACKTRGCFPARTRRRRRRARRPACLSPHLAPARPWLLSSATPQRRQDPSGRARGQRRRGRGFGALDDGARGEGARSCPWWRSGVLAGRHARTCRHRKSVREHASLNLQVGCVCVGQASWRTAWGHCVPLQAETTPSRLNGSLGTFSRETYFRVNCGCFLSCATPMPAEGPSPL